MTSTTTTCILDDTQTHNNDSTVRLGLKQSSVMSVTVYLVEGALAACAHRVSVRRSVFYIAVVCDTRVGPSVCSHSNGENEKTQRRRRRRCRRCMCGSFGVYYLRILDTSLDFLVYFLCYNIVSHHLVQRYLSECHITLYHHILCVRPLRSRSSGPALTCSM